MLNIPRVIMYGKLQECYNAVRLNAVMTWRDIRFGHARILATIPENVRQVDYIIQTPSLDNQFSIRIPGSTEREAVHILDSQSTAIFTDGSKVKRNVGSGIYSKDLSLAYGYRANAASAQWLISKNLTSIKNYI